MQHTLLAAGYNQSINIRLMASISSRHRCNWNDM